MSSLKLVITNPPPKSIRARYRKEVKEGRGFITGENEKNVQLQVANHFGQAWCFNGAKCIGEVKSVATRQTHRFYTLLNNEWDVTTEENGLVKVDLHRLAVLINSGRNQKQKSDRGEFYLEFTLRFTEKQLGPDLSCRTDDMLDKSCKETCKPTIKSVNPQCAAGNEKVWIQCTSDVAKTKEVEAVFSGRTDSQELHFTVGCQVDGKLVKFVMPSLYHTFCIEDLTKLEMRLRVDKNDDIASDTVTFGYLPECFSRANIADSNNMVQKSGIQKMKTFDSDSLIRCPSLNTDSGVVTGLIQPPNGMCNTSRYDLDRFEENNQHPRAFLDTRNPCLYEKEKNGAHPRTDILRKVIQSALLDEHMMKTVNGPTISRPTSNEVIIPTPTKSKIIPEMIMTTEPQNGTELVSLSNAIPTEETQLNKGTLGWNIQVCSDEGKDFETLAGLPIEEEYGAEDISTNDSHFERQQSTDSKPAFNSHEQVTNHFPTFSNNDFESVAGTSTCPPSKEEGFFPANLSVLTAKEDVKNQQKCGVSMASMNKHKLVPSTQSILAPNRNSDMGSGTCSMDVAENFATSSSHLVTGKKFNDLQDCFMDQSVLVAPDHSYLSPSHNFPTNSSVCTSEKYAPENVSTFAFDEKAPQSCYALATFNNDGQYLALNHYDDLPFHSLSIQLEPTFVDSRSDLRLSCPTIDSLATAANLDAWMKELREQNIGGRDIFKEIESESGDTTMEPRSISNRPVTDNRDISHDLYGPSKAKIRKLD